MRESPSVLFGEDGYSLLFLNALTITFTGPRGRLWQLSVPATTDAAPCGEGRSKS